MQPFRLLQDLTFKPSTQQVGRCFCGIRGQSGWSNDFKSQNTTLRVGAGWQGTQGPCPVFMFPIPPSSLFTSGFSEKAHMGVYFGLSPPRRTAPKPRPVDMLEELKGSSSSSLGELLDVLLQQELVTGSLALLCLSFLYGKQQPWCSPSCGSELLIRSRSDFICRTHILGIRINK